VVCRLEPVPGMPTRLRVSHVTPPPYCPICGHPWWREGLAEEAERIANREDRDEQSY